MKLRSILILLPFLIISISLPVMADNSVWNRQTETYSRPLNISVYRSPSCSCCGGWVKHLKGHDFQVKDIKTADMEAIKQKYQVTGQLASCHTALINGYVIEGHVPADDIKRLLKQEPQIIGLSVPQMPVGTPGMEVDNRKDSFSVIAFQKNGDTSVFKTYQSY